MLKLKNVSKFYYSKGVIASGFSKVNLEFNIGEFVAITGESGSGKSTLLNVLSGLDTYEEGEMYINGEETSHYTEVDFEDYRRQYIGNIFQNFNLVNSYTVYQNIELVLLINGFKKNEVKDKINELIKKVDLWKYRNAKVSKLSGGQKQRVAIARALAKDAPIIVADEPTGNLDSRSAKGIMKLLGEISKDKLVIVVTHNYDQVEEYATRKIKMHDGRIIEDKKLKNVKFIKDIKIKENKDMTFINKLLIALRNTFNIIPKFLLLFAVYLFITVAITSEYTSMKKNEFEDSLIGYNQFFKDTSNKRIVFKKNDGSVITEEDYEKIESIDNVDYVVKDDIILDMDLSLSNDDNYLYLYGTISDLGKLEDVDEGRMPKEDNEIVIYGSKEAYELSYEKELLLESEYVIDDNYDSEYLKNIKLKIVGIVYSDTTNYYSDYIFYVNDKLANEMRNARNHLYSNYELTVGNSTLKSQEYYSQYNIVVSDKVSEGNVIIPENLNYYCKNYNCKNRKINIYLKNIYYSTNLDLKVVNIYNKNNYKKLTGFDNYDEYNSIYVNYLDYKKLYKDEHYQSSLFVKDVKKISETSNKLKEAGYTTLVVKDSLYNLLEESYKILNIFKVVSLAFVAIALFFISYFIIRIILKSRNIYFSIVRILGASKNVSKRLLDIELFVVSNLAYFTVLVLIILINKNVISIDYLSDMVTYLKFADFIIMYLILIVMSQLLSNRFSKKLFKSSAMNTYREEV